MSIRLFPVLVLALMMLLYLLQPPIAASQRAKQVAVRGVITGPDNKPIGQVAVRAEHNGRVVSGPKDSKIDGTYELTFDETSAVDIIYNHPAWHPDALSRLSGTRDHTINKVLYRPGNEQRYSPSIVFDILSSYERMAFIGMEKVEGPQAWKQENKEKLAAFGRMPPGTQSTIEALQAKAKHVFGLYDLRPRE